jgi:hypothetical protein
MCHKALKKLWNKDFIAAVGKVHDEVSLLCNDCSMKTWNEVDNYAAISSLEKSLRVTKCTNLEGTQKTVCFITFNIQPIRLLLTKPTGVIWTQQNACPSIVGIYTFDRVKNGKITGELALTLLSDTLLVSGGDGNRKNYLLYPPIPLSKVEKLDIPAQDIVELKLNSKLVLDLKRSENAKDPNGDKDEFLKNLHRQKDCLMILNHGKSTAERGNSLPVVDKNSVQLSRV